MSNQFRMKPRRGTANKASKLDEKKVRFIRANYDTKKPEFNERGLAARFGVTKHAIHAILHRRTWDWVV
jgi:hypothetical protein